MRRIAVSWRRLEREELVIEWGGENLSIPFFIIRNSDSPRSATHLAILYIVLIVAPTGVDADLVGLAAVRAHHNPFGIGRAVTERKLLVQIAVGEVDH
jgi:hypothetical protein